MSRTSSAASMSLNDPKRQRRKVPLPRDAKRGVFAPKVPFVSQGGSNIDANTSRCCELC